MRTSSNVQRNVPYEAAYQCMKFSNPPRNLVIHKHHKIFSLFNATIWSEHSSARDNVASSRYRYLWSSVACFRQLSLFYKVCGCVAGKVGRRTSLATVEDSTEGQSRWIYWGGLINVTKNSHRSTSPPPPPRPHLPLPPRPHLPLPTNPTTTRQPYLWVNWHLF